MLLLLVDRGSAWAWFTFNLVTNSDTTVVSSLIATSLRPGGESFNIQPPLPLHLGRAGRPVGWMSDEVRRKQITASVVLG